MQRNTTVDLDRLPRCRSSQRTSVHVQPRRWTRRRTSRSTTTLAVDDQVNVDDHDAIDEDL
jgi:hypothetical protein